MTSIGTAIAKAAMALGTGGVFLGIFEGSGPLAGAGVGIGGTGALAFWILGKVDEKLQPLKAELEAQRRDQAVFHFEQGQQGVRIDAGMQRLANLERYVEEQRRRTEQEADDVRRRMSLRNAPKIDGQSPQPGR